MPNSKPVQRSEILGSLTLNNTKFGHIRDVNKNLDRKRMKCLFFLFSAIIHFLLFCFLSGMGKEGSFTEAEHELVDKESCDEWEFMDESHLHVTNIRDAKRLDRKPVASSCNKGGIVLSSSLLNSVPDPDHRSAFKPTTEKLSCAMAKSRFLSSMDDGVVHIDDIKLPVNQIDDFVPNCNGCRVFSK